MPRIRHSSQKSVVRSQKFLFWILNSVFCILFYSISAFAGEFTVSMKDWEFKPAVLTIQVGDTVIWSNDEDDRHDVVFEDTAVGASGALKEGQKFSIIFDKAGEYKYYCRFHRSQGMRGAIIVK